MRMRLGLAAVAALVACSAAAQTPPSLAPVMFANLPRPVRAKLEVIGRECNAPPTEFRKMHAYRLDVNADGQMDFIYFPGDGLRAFRENQRDGYCTANWSPMMVAVHHGRGQYKEIVLGTGEAVLVGRNRVIFITPCGEWAKDGPRRFGALDPKRIEVAGFGECYRDVETAFKRAEALGYRAPRFREPEGRPPGR